MFRVDEMCVWTSFPCDGRLSRASLTNFPQCDLTMNVYACEKWALFSKERATSGRLLPFLTRLRNIVWPCRGNMTTPAALAVSLSFFSALCSTTFNPHRFRQLSQSIGDEILSNPLLFCLLCSSPRWEPFCCDLHYHLREYPLPTQSDFVWFAGSNSSVVACILFWFFLNASLTILSVCFSTKAML